MSAPAGATAGRRREVATGLPRLSAPHVERPELVERIEHGAQLIVLHAPSGFGKSTLLAEWSTATRERVAVVRVGADTASKDAFWSAVRDLCAPAGMPPGDAPADPVTLFAALPEPVGLVVDGADRLVELDEVLSGLLDIAVHTPSRVIIGTRMLTSAFEGAARTATDVTWITARDLRLTPPQARAMLPPTVRPEEENDVLALTDHIPVLVRMASQALRAGLLRSDELGRQITDFYDRLLDQDATHATIPLVGLETDLLRIGVAEIVDEELFERLTGHAPGDALAEVERRGLGESADVLLDGRWRRVFRLSRPLRSALLATRERTDAEELRHDLLVWADWARDHGLWVDALEAAVAAEDYERVSALLTENWADFLTIHAGAMLSVLERIEEPVLRRWPVIPTAMALDFVWSPGQQWRARDMLSLAMTAISRDGGGRTPPERFVFGVIALIDARMGSPAPGLAVRRADDVLASVAELEAESRCRLGQAVPDAVNQSVATYVLNGQSARASARLASLQSVLAESRRPRHLYLSAALDALAAASNGDMTHAVDARRRASALGAPGVRQRGFLVDPALITEAHELVEAGEYAAARDLLSEPRWRSPSVEAVHLVMDVWSTACLALGKADEVLLTVDEVHAHLGENREIPPYTGALLQRAAFRAALAAGDDAEAVRRLERFGRLGAAEVGTARAWLQLRRGSEEGIVRALARGTEGEGTPLRLGVERLLLRAFVASDRAGASALTRASVLMELHGLTSPVLMLGADALSRLRERAERAGARALTALDPRVVAAAAHGIRPRVLPSLTARERVVLRQLAAGMPNSRIAAALHVSENTVRTQVRSVLRKLNSHTRGDAARVALSLGLLDDPE